MQEERRYEPGRILEAGREKDGHLDRERTETRRLARAVSLSKMIQV